MFHFMDHLLYKNPNPNRRSRTTKIWEWKGRKRAGEEEGNEWKEIKKEEKKNLQLSEN